MIGSRAKERIDLRDSAMQKEIIQVPPNVDADHWHLYHTLMPRRSISGPVVLGLVWRQRRNGRWIYMPTDEQVRAAVKLVTVAQQSRRSRRLRKL